MTNTPVFPQTLVTAVLEFANADSTNKKVLRSASANGDKIESISATSNDSVNRVFAVWLGQGGSYYCMGSVSVPANAGTDNAATPAVSVLESSAMMPWVRKDSNGRGYLYLASGSNLSLSANAAVTSPKVVDFVGQVGAF